MRELAVEHATRIAGRCSRASREELTRVLALGSRELSRKADAWRAHLEGGGAREVEVSWAQPPLTSASDRSTRRWSARSARASRCRRRRILLGAGLVVRFGHRVLDASLAGELDALRARAKALLAEPS
ncbi:MAG: hypothetical protein R3A48_03670 [Polyangiales bacterium]